MFDIGFWELVMIAVVALVVVGPERLPHLAYTAGKWLARGRRVLGNVKAEIDREIKAEELKRILEEQQNRMAAAVHQIEETTTETRQRLDRIVMDDEPAAPAPSQPPTPSISPSEGAEPHVQERPGG